MAKISEKIIVIDAKTYKEIQQNNSSKEIIGRRIRNAKYKRMSIKFNLMQYLSVKYKTVRNQPNRKRRVKHLPLYCRRSGKQKEYKRIKLSKLKKTILQYRQLKQKRQQHHDLSPMEHVNEVKYHESLEESDSLPRNAETVTNSNTEEDDKSKIHLQMQLLHIEKDHKVTELVYFSQNCNLNTEENMESKIKYKYNGEDAVFKNYDGPVRRVKQQQIIHSGRFREYCDNCITPHLKDLSEQLLRNSYRFQKRAYESNQIKAAAHRRFVIGFHEIQSLLKVKKIKLIIIATDCEKCEGKDGLDEIIANIKATCKDQEVPLAFVFKRRQLAYMFWKKASISCVGLLNYDGLHEIFNKFIIALKDAREMYLKLTHTEKC